MNFDLCCHCLEWLFCQLSLGWKCTLLVELTVALNLLTSIGFFFFHYWKKGFIFFCQCKQVSVLPYAFWCRKPKKTAALVLSCGFAPTPLFSDGLSFLPELLSSCFFNFFFICVLKSFGTEAVFPDRQSRAVAKHRLHSFLIGLLDSLLWCS